MANLRIPIPPRPPRLPRDHFAMRPQLSTGQRIARLIVVLAVTAYGLAQLCVYVHSH